MNNPVEYPNVDNEKEIVNHINVTDLNFLQQEYVNMNEYLVINNFIRNYHYSI